MQLMILKGKQHPNSLLISMEKFPNNMQRGIVITVLIVILLVAFTFRLKAEWLYSQGRGRKFRIGEHSALIRYLTETCPVTCRVLESEQERKLRMILNKAQQYQKQLSQEPPLHEKG